MATYQAIAAVCEAMTRLLRSQYHPEMFGQIELDFRVYAAQDFTSPMQAGVSIFPYRIYANGVMRNPPGRRTQDGARQNPPLPLDVHLLLTIWAKDGSLQNTLAGWLMRCLEDTPILPAALLNATWPNVFRQDETVEVVLGELGTNDLIQLWDRLGTKGFQLSIPYVARVINIDSLITSSAPVVGQRSG